MTYRDDREALHNRVAQLEDELEDARREGQEEGRDEAAKRSAVLEEKIGEMRGELERMELELQAMRGAPPNKALLNRQQSLALAGGLIALGLGTGAFLALRRPAPPPIVVMPPSPTQATPTPERTATPAPTVTPATPPEATQAPTPNAPTRTTTARWLAKVSKVEGLGVAAGAACTLDAIIATNNATNIVIRELIVMCGGQKVYASGDQLNGMAQMSNDAREVLGASDDKSTFTLMYRDIGTRTGARTQIDLDTNARQGTVFRDTIPRFRVDFAVPKESTPGTPLTPPDLRLKRTGKLESITGTSLKAGATCVVRAMPNGKGTDCSAEVACGTTILWPSTNGVRCTYEGSKPISISGLQVEDSSLELEANASSLNFKTKTASGTIALDAK